jgi:sortase A
VEVPIFSVRLRNAIKKSLKWYSYPIIYFLVTSIVCAYAWYTRPIHHRAGIKVVFKTISVIPTLIWVGATTISTTAVILIIAIFYWLRKKFPNLPVWTKVESRSIALQGRVTASLWRKTLNISLSALGVILVCAGLSLAIWISRPYITLLFSTSKVEALENKAQRGQIQGDRIIIPTALVDAPILEGVSMQKLSRGVCHISHSALPGQEGNCVIEGHNLAEFGLWRHQSFFSMLEVLDKGTPVYIFYKGKKYVYRVQEKTYKNVNDPQLFDFNPGKRLTLITCVSTWSPTIYTNKRTVITAYPASFPIK